ncbi:MAG: Blue-light-activated protein, partial [Gemmatimonadetes bacterium]|nr:Blue-light-activated protein [Gemmatimonadota bacterium]
AEAAHRARAADEALFRALTERSVEFVSIVSDAGDFNYLSPSAEAIIGYSADDLLGTPALKLVHPDDQSAVQAVLATLLAEGPGAAAELACRVQHRDGSWRWLEGGARNLLHDEAVRGITTNARDVTARVDAELERANSEARFRRFVETTAEGVLAMDTAGMITYANPRMESLLGKPTDSLRDRTLFDFMPAHEAFAARSHLLQRWHDQAIELETQLVHPDGGLLDVRAAISPIADEHGVVTGTLAVITDITERSRADVAMAEALRAADLDRRRLEATLEAIPVGVWLADAGGQLTHSNPAAARLWGGAAPHAATVAEYGQYRGWSASGAPIAPDDWALARTLRTGETIANEVVQIERFDGLRGFVLNSAAPIHDAAGTLTGGVVISVDITAQQAQARERERLVASLQNERQHLASIFQHAPSFLAVARGPDHVVERVNPAYQALIGDRDVVGLPVAEAMPEVVAQGIMELLDHVRETGEAFVARQLPLQLARVRGAPMETRYVDVVYQRLEQADGEHALVAHGVDVTEQVLATERLVRSKQRLHDQFAKLPVPTYLWEARAEGFALLECNEAGQALLPVSCRDGSGTALGDVFPGMADISDDMRRCLADGGVVRRSVRLDLAPPLGRRMLDLTMGPQHPDRVLVHVMDTTERTELEAQLRQAQKMDAVGRLAGGVAHDFNNLLTVIGAHSAFLLESLDSGDPQHEDATAIHKAAVRAAGLTRQLLAFSRKQILKPVVTDLNATVEETRTMLERLLGEDIEIVTTLAPSLPRVVADPSQLDQVVVNLAVNARDAMPSGGRLTLRTRLVTIPESSSAPGIVPPGAYVALSVTDTGSGMSPAVQARLFEPFFTTKELGKGTGLGLAMVYGIVKQSAGYITVDSTLGQGSTFDVLLPALVAGEEAEQLQEAERASARGVETVLLVEDELSVREVAKRVLRRQGYVVLEAANGEAALEVSRAFASTIHLVVSDAVMPGMRGTEVVRRLQAERPTLRALFMSGYTDDEIVRRGIVSSTVPFVQKPFSPADFARAVREALDA